MATPHWAAGVMLAAATFLFASTGVAQTADPLANATVIDVRSEYDPPPAGESDGRPPIIALGKTIGVTLKGADLSAGKRLVPQNYRLVLDGRLLSDDWPEGVRYQPDGTVVLIFDLYRTAGDKSSLVWDELLSGGKAEKQISVGVALKDNSHLNNQSPEVVLKILPRYFQGYIAALIALVAVFFLLAWRTPMLRDGDKTSPFSLSRMQMAWWFFIVLGSFTYISVITGSFAAITQEAMILTGIALATYAGGKYIDVNRAGQALSTFQAVKVDRAGLQAQLDTARQSQASLSKVTTPDASQQAELTRLALDIPKLEEQLKAVEAKEFSLSDQVSTREKSEDWLTDILSDRDGVTIHRFQMLGWTVVLGMMFAVETIQNLAMPQLGGELLGLMGISSGAYIGFKMPDGKK